MDSVGSSTPTTKNNKKAGVSWWNAECLTAKKAHQLAYDKVHCTGLPTDLDAYKRHYAVAKCVIKQTDSVYWRVYCS